MDIHAVVWRNKADLDTMSIHDLYNNLNVYEPEVKGMSSANSSTQNMAFVSTSKNNNINEAVNTAQAVNIALRGQKVLEENIKQAEFHWIVHVETPALIALVSCDGLGGYDWSDQAEEGQNYVLMAYTSTSSDSKAEAVNTACYVPNRVLVVKPHNKTTYELFHGRTPTLSFMKPFGYPVTILNTLDHFGKFDGSGPDWLFDIDALTRTMNYELIAAGTQSNGFAGTKAYDNSGQARKDKKPIKDYILLPLWTTDLSFSQDPKSSQDDGFQPSSDSEKKVDDDLSKGSKCKDQE
nr:hypothetical protein [Tanacetum cinerariifolium]